ncbi:hypothetical protein ABEV54_05265 [Peribacillus psychrosaccharolyticus]|uniref:hypothetical protein n=1 Tax=Peribacillus psychrosaccharolyticus TaxID=1407 RepID=UPI003D2ACDAA
MRKKALLFLLALSLLAGCTTRAYETNMELGRNELKKQHYLEASEAFDKAYQDNDSAEAKDLRNMSAAMSKAMTAYETSDYPTALTLLDKVIKYKTSESEGKDVHKQAKELKKEVSKAIKESEEMTLKLEEGKVLLSQKQYKEAHSLFREVTESNQPSTSKLKSEAKKLIDKTVQSEDQTGNTSETEKPEETDKQSETKETNESTELTKEEGKELVAEFIKMNDSPNLTIQFDREDEKGNYIFQVYEIVIDNAETKEGHTATWGWYSVNPKTKEVEDLM